MSASSRPPAGIGVRPDTFVFAPVRGRNRAKSCELVPAAPGFISIGMKNTLILDAVGFCSWIGQAAPGDILEYHRGFLALDTMPQGTRLAERERVELTQVARRALWAATQGLVHLVQRRHGADDYTYLIIARPRPKSRSGSLLAVLAEEIPQ